MAKILITGGAGFIGSHTCVRLIEQGYEVVIFDNYSNSTPEVPKKIKEITGVLPETIEGDLLNYDQIEAVFKAHKIDATIHFAAFKAVGESNEKPLEYYNNNITGTLNLIDCMRKYNSNTIVFSSSATVYGMSDNIPFVEDSPLSATNPYGFTKLFIEQILSDCSKANKDMSAVLLRYFNPVGAHKSALIGEDPKGIPNNLVPYISKVASGELACLQVFGNDYNTVDGTGVRDYIHVLDLAEGHVKAVDYAMKHKGVEPINLGTGKGTSVLELLSEYQKVSGKDIPHKIVARREGDIGACYADTKKAKDLLGFETKYSVSEMCLDSWNYVKKSL